MNLVKDGDVVWGTGVKHPDRASSLKKKSIQIRALRGQLSRQAIIKISDSICPEIYGDPGILIPDLFPEFQRNATRKVGIIPHYYDIPSVQSFNNVMPPYRHWRDVVKFITECELVISSSLHGVVVAESFGIPARWLYSEKLPSSNTETNFKYNDYYASTNRSLNDYSKSIEEAKKRGDKEKITNFDKEKFLNSFPHDLIGQSQNLEIKDDVSAVFKMIPDLPVIGLRRLKYGLKKICR